MRKYQEIYIYVKLYSMFTKILMFLYSPLYQGNALSLTQNSLVSFQTAKKIMLHPSILEGQSEKTQTYNTYPFLHIE